MSSYQQSDNIVPHDIEAEQAVLGSLLIDGDSMAKIAAKLLPEDFFNPECQIIYDACANLYIHNVGIDQVTLSRELKRLDKLEEIGGGVYLRNLLWVVPNAQHIEYYADIVEKLAVFRRLISAGSQIQAIGYDPDIEVDVAIERARDILSKVRRSYKSEDKVGGVDL